MDVSGDHAFAERDLARAAQRHVLADRRDQLLQPVFHGRRLAGEMRRLDLLDRAVGHKRDLRDLAGERLELLVARDEIGFRIHLDDRGLVSRRLDRDQAFRRDAAGLLGGLGEPLLAQPVDRPFQVAVRFAERGLAVHHARAGLVAELFDHACGDRRHS